jgi:hypothetical protein
VSGSTDNLRVNRMHGESRAPKVASLAPECMMGG